MNAVEIVLLIAGAVIFAVSFILPEKKNALQLETKELVKDEVQNMVAKEMEAVKGRIDDIVDETVTYAVEKTERSLERISNEKIMAVNEYSDTVLDEIHKNHEEVVFLYDMLSNKQKNIKKTVSEVEKTVKEAKQSVQSVQSTEGAATAETVPVMKETGGEPKELQPFPVKKVTVKTPAKKSSKKAAAAEETVEKVIGRSSGGEEIPEVDLSFIEGTKINGRNNNERILRLHKEGKSNVAIAKELGLGIGEVKLVIDLFEGM